MEAGTTIRVYKILHALGAGGMAQVFLAEDQRLGRKVALKILPADAVQNPDRVRRFEQEARAASALNHPNILTIYDIGDVDSTKFIATEFVDGLTVRELISQRTPVAKVLDMATQVCAALATAHAAGIVHRDIKPENIMLRTDGYVKVLDFGLAKLSRTGFESVHDAQTLEMTIPGMIMGTLGYMSPEQLRGQAVDARTDIWSLGAVLYELITGEAAFAAPTPTDTMVAVLEREPRPMRSFRGDVPEELARIVGKMLAKDRDERFQTVKDVAIDLKRLRQRIESGEHVAVASAIARSAPLAPVRKRSRFAVVAALVGLVILGVFAVLGIAVWRHQSKTANHTEPTVSNQERAPGAAKQESTLNRENQQPQPTVPEVPVPPVPAVPGISGIPGIPGSKAGRELSYFFLIQNAGDSKPVTSSTLAMKSGSRFKVVVASPQAGSLYVIAAGKDGSKSVVFPKPEQKIASTVPAGKPVTLGWFESGSGARESELWLVWARYPLGELEAATSMLSNPAYTRYVGSAGPSAEIANFLEQHRASSASVKVQSSAGKVTLRSAGDPLVYAIKLEER
jgi:tRNA A-37 threonylcarbamoyl transferase component Bud32